MAVPLKRLGQVGRAFFRKKTAFEVDRIPFEFGPLSLGKTVNWLLTESSAVVKPARPWGLPTLIHLEPTTSCNLRCVTCPVTHGLNRPGGHMELSLFRRIVDELAGSLLLMLFWDWGEPFLNPDAYEMIAQARRRGIRVLASTNGEIFARGGHARQVVESGLDALIFSVDGLTQPTYERYRAGGRLELVLEGFRRVAAEKRRRGSATPLLNLRFVVMRHNEAEIPEVEGLARSLGADLLTFRKFFPAAGSGSGPAGFDPDDPGHQRYHRDQQTGGLVRVRANPCKNLWNCPSIHWDGTVCSCTCDYEGRLALGSLRTKSFREIWSGPAARRLRARFRRDWRDIPLCRDCLYAFEGGDMGRESISAAVPIAAGLPAKMGELGRRGR